ncbi:2,5-didehydrogluconate reductase DkgB [Modicisalibacter radicis]|uniref:2,5-didehydrogluconate reductase DkgB n=1 Tax=Halomonas sp. EAR18 TaxID=2518972 RepID=UPI00109C7866|nr:2,5-didehydrogluconate reductase DkgB [Halomonas sp. EAR18]
MSLIPGIGLGTFRLQGNEVIDAVTSGLGVGYRHIDTAQDYGNEAAVGRAIAQGGVPRDEVFVTTKIHHEWLGREALLASLETSLERLGTGWIDLALIHWPSPGGEVPMAESIEALAEARQRGLTRHIGVSNFTLAQMKEVLSLSGGEAIITNQVEVHPYLANRRIVDFCQGHGVQITGYMPLAVGKVMSDPVLQAIASDKGVSPAQVALAWVIARDIVVIPSSTKPAHQRSNLAACELTLSPTERARIDELDCNLRIADPDFAPDWDD